jgi:carbon storage regulator
VRRRWCTVGVQDAPIETRYGASGIDAAASGDPTRSRFRDGEARMLILTRRIGETIRIGTDVQIVVVDVRAQQVRLGIDAPRHVTVLREELRDRHAGAPAPDGPGPESSD